MAQLDLKKVGERIRKRRELHDLSQAKLSAMTGISQGFLSSIENGGKNLSSYNLFLLCKALGVSADYLLFGEDRHDSPFANPIVSAVWSMVCDNRLVAALNLETGTRCLMLVPNYYSFEPGLNEWFAMGPEQLEKLKNLQDVVMQKSMTDEECKKARMAIFTEHGLPPANDGGDDDQ